VVMSLILDTRPELPVWYTYTHSATLSPGAPPTIVYVSISALADVLRLSDARSNSEWARLFANGGQVLVDIIGTGTRR